MDSIIEAAENLLTFIDESDVVDQVGEQGGYMVAYRSDKFEELQDQLRKAIIEVKSNARI
jgi:hypothetical protein